MKTSIFIPAAIVLLLLSERVMADYVPPHFFEMVGGAELIVAGEITELGDETYLLKIERFLAGTWREPAVEVTRYRDWVCSHRWAPYAKGQRIVAFLDKDDPASQKSGRPIFQTWSAGCEGEFPVVEGVAYCYTVPAVAESQCGAIGRHDSVVKARVENLYSAIEDYRQLYHITLGEGEFRITKNSRTYLRTTKVERIQSPAATETSPFRPRRPNPTTLGRLEDYARRSYVHRFLVNSTERIADELGAADIGWRNRAELDVSDDRIIQFRSSDQ